MYNSIVRKGDAMKNVESFEKVIELDLVEALDYYVDCKEYEGEEYDYGAYRRALALLEYFWDDDIPKPSRDIKDAQKLVELYAFRFLEAIEDGSADPYIEEAREMM